MPANKEVETAATQKAHSARCAVYTLTLQRFTGRAEALSTDILGLNLALSLSSCGLRPMP